MAKPTPSAKAPTPTKAPAKAAPTPQVVGAAPATAAADLLAMTGVASVAEQADRLGNARLQAIQRQLLADNLGQNHGNGHVQQVMALVKPGRPVAPYQPNISTSDTNGHRTDDVTLNAHENKDEQFATEVNGTQGKTQEIWSNHLSGIASPCAIMSRPTHNKFMPQRQRSENETDIPENDKGQNGTSATLPASNDLIPDLPEQPAPFSTIVEPTKDTSVKDRLPKQPSLVGNFTPPTESLKSQSLETNVSDSASPQALTTDATQTEFVKPFDLSIYMQSMGEVSDSGVSETVDSQDTGQSAINPGEDASEANLLLLESQALAENIGVVGTQKREAVASQVSQLLNDVRLAAEQARTSVASTWTTQRNIINAQTESASAAIAQESVQRRTAIHAFAQTERGRLHTTHQANRENAHEFINGLKIDTLSKGASEAQRALLSSEERAKGIIAEAQTIRSNDEAASADAQREAAQRIATHTANKCRQTGKDVAQRVQQEANQHTITYDELLQAYLQQLDQILTNAEAPLNEFVGFAVNRINTLAQQGATFLRETRSQSLTKLETEKKTNEVEIQTWEEQATHTIEQAGMQIDAPVQNQIVALQTSLTNCDPTITDMEQLHAGHDEAIIALEQWHTGTKDELEGLFNGFNTQLTNLVSERNSGLEQAGMQITEILHKATLNATTQMDESQRAFEEKYSASINSAVEQIETVTTDFQSKTQGLHQEALTVFERLVNDALASEDQLIAQTRAEITSASSQIANKYTELKTEAEQRSATEQTDAAPSVQRNIWGSITGFISKLANSVKQWLISKLGEFWGGLVFGILAGLVIVLIGFAAAKVVGLLVGLFIASAKVAAIVTAVILIAAAVGFGIYNRFQEFYADHPGEDAGFWRGLALVGLGIADLTGIPFIIEAAVGRRAFSPRDMTPSERGERLGMGIVFAFAFIYSAAKGIRTLLRSRLIERVGSPSKVNTRRTAEIPYKNPPDMKTVRPGEPLDVNQLDPNKKYLWVVDEAGNVKIAPEEQGNFGANSTYPEGRLVKHGDLTPGEGGAERGVARAGGELVAERGPDGKPTGRWVMNNDSSYTFNRTDSTVLGQENLDAAHELLSETGTDTSTIIPKNTSGRR